MIGHLGLERSFQNRFGQLLEQTVFPDDILGLLVVGEQLINQLLVDCHGVFHFLPPIAVYTVLFTPSFSAHNTLHFRQESCTFGDFRAAAGYHVVSISKIHPERAVASPSIRVLTSLASL